MRVYVPLASARICLFDDCAYMALRESTRPSVAIHSVPGLAVPQGIAGENV